MAKSNKPKVILPGSIGSVSVVSDSVESVEQNPAEIPTTDTVIETPTDDVVVDETETPVVYVEEPIGVHTVDIDIVVGGVDAVAVCDGPVIGPSLCDDDDCDNTPTPVVVQQAKKISSPEQDKLQEMIDEYVGILVEDKKYPTNVNLERKITLTQNILLYPFQAGVSNVGKLFDTVLSFFRENRRGVVAESVMVQYINKLQNKTYFRSCMTMYTCYIELVDMRTNGIEFKLSVELIKTALGVEYDSFVAWLVNKINK